MVQPGLQQRLGATVLIENRPGGSGSIGTAAVARATPDGNTWLFVFDTHAVNPALIPNLSYDSQKDLDPVLLIGTAPNVLATHPSRPYQSLAEVIAGGAGEAAGGHLRDRRGGQPRPPHHGSSVEARRGRARARALSRRRSGDQRRHRRPRRSHHRQH